MVEEITIFQSACHPGSGNMIRIEEFLSSIREGKYRDKVEPIRKETNPERAKALKKKLPAITVSGTFSKRGNEGLEAHSGLLQIDIDGKENPEAEIDPEGVRDHLGEDPHIRAAFISASGNGVKAFLRIDPTRHKDSFIEAERYFFDRHNLKIDPACKDVGRLCFVSYDPDLRENKEAEALPLPERGAETLQDSCSEGLEGLNPRLDGYSLQDLDKDLSKIDPDLSRDEWLRVAVGIKHQFPDEEEQAFERFHEWSAKGTKYTGEADCRKLWDDFSTHNRSGPDLTIREVQRLAGENWEPETKNPLTPISWGERVLDPPSLPPQLIDGLLYCGGVALLVGASKARKTYSMLHLAACIASGTDWLGMKVMQGPVLFVDFELIEGEHYSRIDWILESMGVEPEAVKDSFYSICLRGRRNVTFEDIRAAVETMSEKPVFVAIDPYYRLSEGADEIGTENVSRLMFDLQSLGVAVMICHHSAKGNTEGRTTLDLGSGSGVFGRAPDLALGLREVAGSTVEQPLARLEAVARSFPPQPDKGLRWVGSTWQLDEGIDTSRLQRKTGRPPTERKAVVALLEGKELSTSEWQHLVNESLGIGKTAFHSIKTEALRLGEIRERAEGAKRFVSINTEYDESIL